MSTLIGALRSDNPLGGAPLSYSEAGDAFTLQGVGEIDAAKLLDLENRRQLVWADPVTREWALELAAIRVRKEKEAAAKAAAWAAEAAAAAAAHAAAAPVTGGGETIVFQPPAAADQRRPSGVRAAQTRFETPDASVARGGETRVVWSETPAVEPHEAPQIGADVGTGQDGPPATGTAAAVAAAWAAAVPVAGAATTGPVGPGGPASGAPPPWAASAPVSGQAATDASALSSPSGSIDHDLVTRRTDRRSARRQAEHRRASSAAWLRIVLYILIAVAVGVVLFLMQQGTIGF